MELKAALALIAEGEHERLIGIFESEFSECKRTPYRLSEEGEKLELAKDVSALANAGGGVLLLGFGTSKDDVHGRDRIAEVCAFPAQLFDEAQYAAVIGAWLWPRPEILEARSFASKMKPTHVVAVIHVAAATSASGPILIRNSLLQDGKKTGLLFGYCERKRSAVEHLDLPRLQGLLRDGMRYESGISDGFASIRALLQTRSPVLVDASPIAEKDIQEAIRAADLVAMPAFYLAASCTPALNLVGIFESRNDPVVQLLHEPPAIRSRGFGIDVDINSKILESKLRRSVVRGDRVLEVHRTGQVIFAFRANHEGLCWNSKGPRLRINQLALIEMTYNFVQLVHRIYAGRLSAAAEIILGIGLRDAENEGAPILLGPGPIDRYLGTNASPAPTPNYSGNVMVTKTQSIERSALVLVQGLYNWFGIETSRIPYTEGEGEARVISRAALEGIGP